MTGVPVLTTWRRHCHILHSKAGIILPPQNFSTYCPLPINGQVHSKPICHISKNSGRDHYCPSTLQVYHLRETHVRGVSGSIALTPLGDASEDIGIPNFGRPFRVQIEEDWGHIVSGLVVGYDQNVLIDSIFIYQTLNGMLYYCQPFQCATSVEYLGLDCKVEYSNANQGIMPDAHNIWVQYTQSEENDLDNTFQGRISSFLVLNFR